MNELPLQNILRSDGVELGFDNGDAARVVFKNLVAVDGGADEEIVFESVFEGLWRAGGCGRRATAEQGGEEE